jgi:hypothetical protein
MSIRTATAEDASGILVCLLAAFEEYRDSYHFGRFCRYRPHNRDDCRKTQLHFRTIQHKRDLLMKIMLCI